MASNSYSGTIGAFLGGAIIGFGAAILFAPQSGTDLRKRLIEKLNRHSIILSDTEVDELIARLEADNEDFI